jgi:hypothetical protein
LTPALPANIRLKKKQLRVKNAPAYCNGILFCGIFVPGKLFQASLNEDLKVTAIFSLSQTIQSILNQIDTTIDRILFF